MKKFSSEKSSVVKNFGSEKHGSEILVGEKLGSEIHHTVLWYDNCKILTNGYAVLLYVQTLKLVRRQVLDNSAWQWCQYWVRFGGQECLWDLHQESEVEIIFCLVVEKQEVINKQKSLDAIVLSLKLLVF